MRILILGLLFLSTAVNAQLSGRVSSAEESAMEGVLVSAKKAGSTITITVVSDKEGRYGFPAAKLDPGRYTIRIRAVGYDLEGPGTLDIAAQPATLDRTLMSSQTSAAVDSAFNALAQTVLVQNARTLEDLVREMLRPLLKSWLDDNLPGMVERIVKAEIERVARGRS